MASAAIQGESGNYSKSGDGENLVLLRHCHKKGSSVLTIETTMAASS